MKNKIMKIGVLAIVCIAMLGSGCSKGNLDYVKENAEARWLDNGFEVIGYDGWQRGFWGFGDHGGAKVWYRLRNIEDNGVTYKGLLWRWGDELHIYNVKAVDAIQP